MLRDSNFGLSDPLNVLKFAIISGQLLGHEYFHFNILTIVFERIAWAFALASFLSVLLSSVTLVSRSWTMRPKLFTFITLNSILIISLKDNFFDFCRFPSLKKAFSFIIQIHPKSNLIIHSCHLIEGIYLEVLKCNV